METIKVRVTSADDNNWYKVGEEHIVAKEAVTDRSDGSTFHPVVEDGQQRRWGIGADDYEIINEQKENKMKQEKKPHKHAEVIRKYADGYSVQWHRSNEDGWEDIIEPSFVESYHYRIKPEPEFPKTTLEKQLLWDFYMEQESATAQDDLYTTVNMALRHFVESGQMDAYIKERDNAA